MDSIASRKRKLDLTGLVVTEIKAAAGLFFGLCRSIDVALFPRTFEFCFSLLSILNAEFERRREVLNA